MPRITCFLLMILLATACVSNAATIDVMIKGNDDGVKTNKQQDYNEAVMNAKLQAIERAGIEIHSIARVVNFRTKFDMVEKKATAVLVPGFRIMDVGYLEDQTYQVVLFGKVKTVSEKTPARPGVEKEDLDKVARFDGRFEAFGNGVVLDTKTALEWYGGPDKDTSWHEAKVWAGSLTVAGGGWELPSIRELQTLYNTEKHNMTPLHNVAGKRVWSAKTKGFSSAYFLDFTTGSEFRYDKSVAPTNGRALAVRRRKQ